MKKNEPTREKLFAAGLEPADYRCNIGQSIENIIKQVVTDTLNNSKEVAMPPDVIETDNIGEVIEKLSILHCRMWYLEDAVGIATSDSEIADLKRKVDICFKQKRPKYVEAINRMIEKSIIEGKSLIEDSVKMYKGHEK
jgi:hypothetical protein